MPDSEVTQNACQCAIPVKQVSCTISHPGFRTLKGEEMGANCWRGQTWEWKELISHMSI